jgi:hypothetical protein
MNDKNQKQQHISVLQVSVVFPIQELHSGLFDQGLEYCLLLEFCSHFCKQYQFHSVCQSVFLNEIIEYAKREKMFKTKLYPSVY